MCVCFVSISLSLSRVKLADSILEESLGNVTGFLSFRQNTILTKRNDLLGGQFEPEFFCVLVCPVHNNKRVSE